MGRKAAGVPFAADRVFQRSAIPPCQPIARALIKAPSGTRPVVFQLDKIFWVS